MGRGGGGVRQGTANTCFHAYPQKAKPNRTKSEPELSLSEQPPYMQISHIWLPLALLPLSLSLSLALRMQNQIIQIQLLSILFIINAHNCQICQIYERS